MPRIVSLIASATEILCALGFEDQLVGRSHECDFPESVRRLPVCTEPKFPTDGSSADIDRRVKDILRDGLSVYRVHAEVLKELRPDVIVTQSLCEVCAVTEDDLDEALYGILDYRPRVISLSPNILADVWTDIYEVAEALGSFDRAPELVWRLRQRMKAIEQQTIRLSPHPTVLCIEWIEPLMVCGNWMPELVKMAGGNNLFGEAGKHAPSLTWEQLCISNPDVILVLPCGFDIERTRREMPALTRKPEWTMLQAVRGGQVFLLDGNQFFNRPGPRLVESLEILAEVLHPGTFAFGHEWTGWERWSEHD